MLSLASVYFFIVRQFAKIWMAALTYALLSDRQRRCVAYIDPNYGTVGSVYFALIMKLT